MVQIWQSALCEVISYKRRAETCLEKGRTLCSARPLNVSSNERLVRGRCCAAFLCGQANSYCGCNANNCQTSDTSSQATKSCACGCSTTGCSTTGCGCASSTSTACATGTSSNNLRLCGRCDSEAKNGSCGN